MKIKVSFKTPNAIDYAIRTEWENQEQSEDFNNLDEEEQDQAFDEFSERLETFLYNWVEIGESITVEFDTDTGTASVLKAKRR